MSVPFGDHTHCAKCNGTYAPLDPATSYLLDPCGSVDRYDPDDIDCYYLPTNHVVLQANEPINRYPDNFVLLRAGDAVERYNREITCDRICDDRSADNRENFSWHLKLNPSLRVWSEHVGCEQSYAPDCVQVRMRCAKCGASLGVDRSYVTCSDEHGIPSASETRSTLKVACSGCRWSLSHVFHYAPVTDFQLMVEVGF